MIWTEEDEQFKVNNMEKSKKRHESAQNSENGKIYIKFFMAFYKKILGKYFSKLFYESLDFFTIFIISGPFVTVFRFCI